MTAFFEINQDYLLLISGLAFAFTAMIARALGRIDQQPAWKWLFWFGLGRGFHTWIEMTRLIDPRIAGHLAILEQLLLVVSCTALVEFARCFISVRHRGRPTRWIHLPVLGIASLLSSLDPRGAAVSMGLLLSCLGGTAAAYALWTIRHSAATTQERRRWKIAALTFFAASTGPAIGELLVTSGAFVAPSLVLAETFLACAITLSLGWCYMRRAQNSMPAACIPAWRNRRTGWIAIACVVIAAGWIAAETVGVRHERSMRRDVLLRTQLVAATVEPGLAKSLRWDNTDLHNPAYQELKSLMVSLVKANPDLRFVLLAGLRAGQCHFIVDSEAPDSPDYSPPGQAYSEAEPVYVSGMNSRAPFVLGPIHDRWGTWIISSVPLLDLPDGRSINAELNISADDWNAAILRARLPVSLIVLLILSLLLLSFHSQERIREQMDNLALSEQRNSTLVEGSPDCIQMLDPDGRCLTINHRGLVALGHPASNVIGRPFVELWPASARPQVLGAIQESAAGKTVAFEAGYQRPDGRAVTWRVSISPVRDPSSRLRSLVCICTDITESKNTERTLFAAKEAAEAADRAKSEFLAVMSHEIRTPLGGVIGMLEILRRQSPPPGQRRYIDLAHGSAETLLEILDDILDASKVESGRLQLENIAFRLEEEFLRVLEIMKLRAEAKHLALDWSFDRALPVALIGDPTRLRQVLANLLSNAIKFTASGGIAVAVDRPAEIGEKISLRIRVTDTGVGIAPAAQAGLFAKFMQADASTTRSYGGTGLGLSIVKGLVEQMGGAVSVESTLGKGTTFQVQVPLAVAREEHVTDSPLHAAPVLLAPHHRSLRLLCAEDDAVHRAIAENHAREMGHLIVFVPNGAEALEKLRQADFDAVLMDNRMPVMDGFQATRAIRNGEGGVRQPLVPIIAVTANASSAYRDECLSAGMNDFLTKPLRHAEFHRALAAVITAGDDDATVIPQGLTEAELLALLDDDCAAPKRDVTVEPQVFAMYLEETARRFVEMRTALETRDAATFARAAHSIKSTSLYVHARELSEIAASLEKSADLRQFSELSGPLAQAERLFEDFKKSLHRPDSPTSHSAT